MFGWLNRFVNREVIADVPAELDMCQDCGELACTEGEFQSCARRKKRAEDLASAAARPR